MGEAAIDLDIRPASVNDPDGGNVNPVPVTGDFTITVDPAGGAADTMPAFSVSFFADQAFTTGTPVNLTLPAATGGDGALTYSLTPAIPGLTLDPTTRVLSGTPTVSAGETSFTYTVTDEDDDTASLVFDVEVMLGGPAPVRPVFFQVASSTFTDYDEGGTAVGGPTTFFAEAGTETVVLTLGGADAAFFSITQAGALSFNPAPDYEMPRGMAPSGSNTNFYRVTITATASRGLTQDQGVTVHVVDVDEMVDAMPTFAGGTFIDDQAFMTFTAVDLTLPAATGGDGALTYSLTPAIAGLTLNPTTRVLSGTPTSIVESTHTYTVTDEDGDAATLAFDVVVTVGTPPVAFAVNAGADQTVAPGATVTLTATVTGANTPDADLTVTWGVPSEDQLNLAGDVTSDAGRLIGAIAAGTDLTLTFTVTAANLLADSTADVVFPVRVSVTDPNGAGGNVTVTDTVTITIMPAAGPPDTTPAFSVSFFADQAYTTTTAVNVTFPAATGGNGALTYTLTPAIAGLTLNPTTRVLSGTPSSITESTHTYTVTDEDNDAATLSIDFVVMVAPAPVRPTFFQLISTVLGGPEGVTALATPTTFFAQAGSETIVLTLSGPDAALFSITQGGALSFRTAPDFEMPRGMAPSGTNTNTYRVTVTATASGGGTRDASLTVTITDVVEVVDAMPTFAAGTFIADQAFMTLTAVDLTLPAATGGDGALTYSLTPTIAGLTLDPTTRVLSGMPTNIVESTHTYTVADEDNDIATLAFDVVVTMGTPPDTAPSFGGATVANQVYTVGTLIQPLTLPAATGGNGPLIYSRTTINPLGLIFTGNTRVLTGTPTAVTATRDFTLVVRDSDGNNANSDGDTLTFTITVVAPVVDSPPSFGTETIADQIFTVGTEVDLTLPVATGGNNGITYSLTTPPTGLTFTPSTRALSGTPAAAFAATDLTYSATDGDANVAPSDRADLMFSITANEPVVMATGITVFARRNPGNSQVTEVLEGTTRPLRVLAIPQPFGSAFPAEQQVTFTVTPASPAARPDSPDDPYVAYNNIAARTVVLAVGAENVGTSITLRPTQDAFDHADFPLTITATAQPSGISGSATLTLIDNDITIATTLAATTVVAGATATYDVQLSEQPPTTTTVTVASQGAGTATVSPATLAFTTTNWNTARTVTVTGVAAGTTTIRHTAPDSTGYTFVTNDVDVTVTAAPVAPVFTRMISPRPS